MKKSLIAAAALATVSVSTFAAPNIVLYGRLDTGLLYQHKDMDEGSNASTDTLSMESSFNTGSRWGLRGEEDIGNGVKVGFVLESGFNSDKGSQADSSRLFNRESTLHVAGSFGTFYFGRVTSIAGDSGSVELLYATAPFPRAWGDGATSMGSTGSAYSRYDNSIVYVSPTYAGFDFRVMYSFKGNEATYGSNYKENSRDAERYAALGLRYKTGGLTAVLTGEYTMHDGSISSDYNGGKDLDDGYSIILGGNYDFGVFKFYAKANYFDNQRGMTDSFGVISACKETLLKGWGASIGVGVPFAGGELKAIVGYRDAEGVEDSSNEFKRLNAAVGYEYLFSKRTSIYGVVGYAQEDSKYLDTDGVKHDHKPSIYQVAFGLVHKF